MLFDPNRGAAQRQIKLLAFIATVAIGCFWLAVIYVAVHFIAKFW